MRFSILPAFILLLPLAEISGFVVVGRAIGLWLTLALVMLGFVLAVHGITDEFLKDKQHFEEVAEQILTFLGDAKWI
ncbi:FxsA family protein, partial [Rhizobium ruizarguesonis]